jgi:flagellar biosynthesis/type III secretory pathway protein FliH
MLEHPAQGSVIIELHPQDKEVLQRLAPESLQGMRLDAVDDLSAGSVRVFANDAVIEDLIEHRLQAVVAALDLDESEWKKHSLLLKPLATSPSLNEMNDSTESPDVHP